MRAFPLNDFGVCVHVVAKGQGLVTKSACDCLHKTLRIHEELVQLLRLGHSLDCLRGAVGVRAEVYFCVDTIGSDFAFGRVEGVTKRNQRLVWRVQNALDRGGNIVRNPDAFFHLFA